ncbi:hypothetical protein LPJ53_003057 [Coemansia erecta]|uniref:Alpha/beta hydrolase fold-3 domain-containing protein n=1 Tax=Coemansia erecta TaxID=147472 RepID=A0A9W8CR81_9FUNG|nr:hypothetical protein LPJ53_003057 [Coemansia erecta]
MDAKNTGLTLVEMLTAAWIALAVALRSAAEYLLRGPRLPAWDLRFQLQRDIGHALIKSALPPGADDDTALPGVDVFALGAAMQRKALPARPLAASQGIHAAAAIATRHVPLDAARLLAHAGVARSGLQELIDSDGRAPGAGRQLGGELVVARRTAELLEPHAHAGHASLLTCAPLYADEPLVLFLHGGGFVVGSAAAYRHVVCRLSDACGARVLSVDYRLAPQHAFPAQLHDVLVAYSHVLAQGFAARRLTVVGDSAGAHLATTLALLLRRSAAMPLPASLVLLSPISNLVETKPSVAANAPYDFIVLVPLESPVAYARMLYAPAKPLTPAMREEMRHPLVSPAFGDFAGFPPVLVQAGAREILVDDIEQLVAAIRAANPARPDAVVYEPYKDMCHVFQNMLDRPESAAAFASIGRFVSQNLA